MFTGIIEQLGRVVAITDQGSNRTFTLEALFPDPIRIDQSIAHEGVCLTVTALESVPGASLTRYTVTAVQETLEKTNLGHWKVGTQVNVERCLQVGSRLDGHFVQGHVDGVGTIHNIEVREGSWMYEITYPAAFRHLIVDKGSICVNGVSLTVVKAGLDHFSLTLIPYTFTHTSFQALQIGDRVNLEFDILGKYLHRMIQTGMAPAAPKSDSALSDTPSA